MTTTSTGRFPAISVRTRIAVAVALLTAMAMAGAGLTVYAMGSAALSARAANDAAAEQADFATYLQNAPGLTVPEVLEGFLSSKIPGASELMVGFWDGQTQLRSASPRGQLAHEPVFIEAVTDRILQGGAVAIDSSFGRVHLDIQPVADAERQGAFVVAHFKADDRASLQRTMRTFVAGASAALLAVVMLAWWQAGRLLQPVRVLRETAQAIEESGLSMRIPVTGNDDITDLTRTLNAMLDRLEKAFTAQRSFLDDAGHELRTPLTIVRGHLEVIDLDDPEDIAQTHALVLDEVDRMSRLVDDLLTLAKADRPDFVVPTLVDGRPLLETVGQKVRALGDREWVVEAPAGRAPALVWVDEQRITQALLQLAQNAVKHTDPGDRIELGLRVTPLKAIWWVSDVGPGVPDDLKATVFERFSRGTHTPGDEGFGLGLSIVAAIVAAHGGSVSVLDVVPHGARFVMEIPRRGEVDTWPAS